MENIQVLNNMPVKYFLRNNSFLNFQLNMSSTDEHLINYTLAKAQKKIFSTFEPIKETININDLKDVFEIEITIEEIQQILKDKNQNKGNKLVEYCEALKKVSVGFVKYTTGEYATGPLVALFTVARDMKSVKATILKDVYLFLYDYNLDMRDSKIVIDKNEHNNQLLIEYNGEGNEKEDLKDNNFERIKLAKGYSRVELCFFEEIRSIYARNMLMELKAAIEKSRVYNANAIAITKVMTIDEIREKFFLEKKYKKYNDLKNRVIDNAIDKINESGYMEVDYKEVTQKVRGGTKVIAVEINAVMTEKLLMLDAKYNNSNNEIKVPESKSNKKLETLGESLSAKLRSDGRLNVGGKTINELIELYGEELVRKSVMALLAKNEEERVRAPKKYLLAVLADMEEKKYMLKKKAEMQLQQQEDNGPVVIGGYEVNQLELDLLGWND